MASSPRQTQLHDSGYATVSALTLCAAVSLMCAAMLGLAASQRQQSQRDLFRLQQEEALNTAVMRFAVQIVRAQGDATIAGEEVVEVPNGQMKVQLRAEHESRKWPLASVADLDDSLLKSYTSLTKSDLLARAANDLNAENGPKDDCVRTLVSPYGLNDPKKAFPHSSASMVTASGHDGQIWRIRAVNGGRVQERRVRFLGDPDRLFAVMSQEDKALGEMPTCAQMIDRP